MEFNSAFKGLKLFKKHWERAFKQFKWTRLQCVKHKSFCIYRTDHTEYRQKPSNLRW